MHHQTDEESSRSEKWLKFSGTVEYAWHLVKNALGRRAAEVFMETTEEHKVLRPIKRAKIHKSLTVTEKGPSHGKIWSYRASWRGGHVPKFAMRQQRKDVSLKCKEAQRKLRCYFSGVSQRRLEREFPQLLEHIAQFKPYYAFLNVWNWSLLRSEGEVQNWVRRRSYNKISTKPTDWTPEVNYHITWKMAEKSVLCGELRAPRCPGFYRLFLHALPHVRLRHRYRRTMIFPCVQQQYEVKIWVNKHKETCYKPSHTTANKHGKTRYRLNCHKEKCNRKGIHTHFLKDRNCEMQECQNFLDSMQETHRWSHTSSSKIWENW